MSHEIKKVENEAYQIPHHITQALKTAGRSIDYKVDHTVQHVSQAVGNVVHQVKNNVQKVEHHAVQEAKKLAHEVVHDTNGTLKSIKNVTHHLENGVHVALDDAKKLAHHVEQDAHQTLHSVQKLANHLEGNMHQSLQGVKQSVQHLASDAEKAYHGAKKLVQHLESGTQQALHEAKHLVNQVGRDVQVVAKGAREVAHQLEPGVEKGLHIAGTPLRMYQNYENGMLHGVVGGLKDTVHMVLHPIETVHNVGTALEHPGATLHAIKVTAEQQWKEFKQAPLEKKAYLVGEFTGEVAANVVGGKGVGAGIKIAEKVAVKGAEVAGKAATKVAEHAGGVVGNLGPTPALAGVGSGTGLGSRLGVATIKGDDRLSNSVTKAQGHPVEGGKTVETVKYGEQYARVDGKKALKPNVEYTDPNGYKYKTDSQGRISNVEAELQKGTAPRNKYAQSKVGGTDRLPSDQGGHLIASIFKGSGNLDNLVPMDANLNKGAYKTLENTWSKAVDSGQKVDVNVKPRYSGNSSRPSSFTVSYTIDKKQSKTVLLENSPRRK